MKTILLLYVVAASGLNVTWKVAMACGPRVKGKEYPLTVNSGRLLETPRIEMGNRPLFVTVTAIAELVVLTGTDPKLSELGLTPTPAWTGAGKSIVLMPIIPTTRHTNSVLRKCTPTFVFN